MDPNWKGRLLWWLVKPYLIIILQQEHFEGSFIFQKRLDNVPKKGNWLSEIQRINRTREEYHNNFNLKISILESKNFLEVKR
jgi:hypothetical protein